MEPVSGETRSSGWYQSSFKNKLLVWVVFIFVLIYGATLLYVYHNTSEDLLRTTKQELEGSTAILAMALYRNYELDNDAREIQSFILGSQSYQPHFVEVSVIALDFSVISSTNENRLFTQAQGEEYIEAMGNKIVSSSYFTSPKPYLRMIYPISAGKGEANHPTGAIETTLDISPQIRSLEKTLWLTLAAGGFIVLALIFVISLMCKKLTEPIHNLYAGMASVDDDKLDVYVEPTWRDEVGFLTLKFNQMVSSLRVSRLNLKDMVSASLRFVPVQFLQMLDKSNIQEVALGDANIKNMTVLFLDIRDFTGLSRLMSASQVLHFLNELHQGFLPLIEKHGGFVDKYIGDAIMAIFPTQSADALLAGIDMLRRVEQYNQKVGINSEEQGALRVGIGINSGEAIIGTIGDEKRMDTTVIGDMVNKASRFEGLTKTLGYSIVFSEDIYESLSMELVRKLNVKDLGKVSVRGYFDPVHVYGISSGV